MSGKVIFYFLIPAGIIILSYVFQAGIKQKFKVPHMSSCPDAVINITLLGTNDLHSTISGLGLKSYPKEIQGGYSKLVYLINSIR